MAETELQRIMRKTGRKLTQCKCGICKKQCEKSSCLGTPADIEKLIDLGYGDKIIFTLWGTGVMWGIMEEPIPMYQAEFIKNHGCILYKDGLCSIHSMGLKPTGGKLSHHVIMDDNYSHRKSITRNVAITWLDPANAPIIERIKEKLKIQ